MSAGADDPLPAADPAVESRAREILERHRRQIFERTDGLFARLMIAQWVAGVAAAVWITPTAWVGRSPSTHVHVWTALLLGGAIALLPVVLALRHPGERLTRHVIAVGQMLASALLIHLTGGRIETHFHVFGSLAFLAFYRDWTVLVSATVVVAADHFLRGLLLPQSVYGVSTIEPWRWLEHAGWVLFEDAFLTIACIQSLREMREIAKRRALLERTNEVVEAQVLERTTALRRQASLLDKARDAIVACDLGQRVLYWNLGAERLYGWTAAEAVGRTVSELGYARPDAFAEAFAKVLEHREWTGELLQTDREGKALAVESRWTLVDDDAGRPDSILLIDTDVTERKRLEQQVLRAQRLDSIGTLAGGIAHDLNNVFAPILTGIGVLKASEQDDRRRKVLATLEASTERGANMVRQVLSFARGVDGKRLDVDVRTLVRDVERIVEDTFLKAVRVKTHVPPDVWTVPADPTQLHQVLLNLCVNARDAMPGGGLLTIVAENVTLGEPDLRGHRHARPGPYVVFHVSDTGFGMEADVVERIFEPFFTTKDVGKGTGLGLTTSLAIVKSHGGFFRVYSEPGNGSTFHVYLPAKGRGSVRGDEPAAEELPRGGGETVLVVDDEEGVRQILAQTLEAFGYRVLVASSGSEALATYSARRSDVDLVLTDMMMPGMDGSTLVELLRKVDPDVRVIASSGLGTKDRIGRVVDAGCRHFLAKPFTAETLLRVVRTALDSGPVATPTAP
jgi:PAS domain S-box-containing protein